MAAQSPETPPPSAPTSAPAKKRNLVPILIVVGVIVVIIIGAGVYKLTKSSSSTKPSGKPPAAISRQLYKAWQAGDQTAAAKLASPTAVTTLFAMPASDGTGLSFGGCSKATGSAFPKACVFTRPGGKLTFTVTKANGKKTITQVQLGSTATTPT